MSSHLLLFHPLISLGRRLGSHLAVERQARSRNVVIHHSLSKVVTQPGSDPIMDFQPCRDYFQSAFAAALSSSVASKG